MNLDQAQIKGTLYDLKDRYKWTGTKAEWDALDKSTLPQDAEVIVNITDDYDESTPGITIDTLTTLEQVNAETDVSKPVGAGAVKELNNSLIANSKRFYFDYQNGKYGYNTSSSRGADTFFPFSSFKYGTFYIASYTETQSINCGFKPKSVIVICNTTNNMIAYKSDTIDRIDANGSLNNTPSGITLTNTGFDFCAYKNYGDNWWNGKTVYYLAFGSDAVMG